MYLITIIDWYSRIIVGWGLADKFETCHVIKAVRNAVTVHGFTSIPNSNQGIRFTGTEYRNLLKEYHITQSMDGHKHWVDKIMVERWFCSLKQEEICNNEYRSPRELHRAIGE